MNILLNKIQNKHKNSKRKKNKDLNIMPGKRKNKTKI